MKLGAAMIVKGDADLGPAIRSIYACIPTASPLAVCVDTRHGTLALGFMDDGAGTQFIADPSPFEMWTDTCIHFSANRNRSIDLCPADWVFMLDADETVSGPVREAVDKADRLGVNALYVEQREYWDGVLSFVFKRAAAIRKGTVRYQFPVHNQLLWSGAETGHLDTRVVIHSHYPADMCDRHPRSLPGMLKLWRTPDPHPTVSREAERAHAAFYLQRMAGQRGRLTNGVKWARRCGALESEVAMHVDAYVGGVMCAAGSYGWEAAVEMAHQGIKAHGYKADLCWQLAGLWLYQLEKAKTAPHENTLSGKYRKNLAKIFELLGQAFKVLKGA